MPHSRRSLLRAGLAAGAVLLAHVPGARADEPPDGTYTAVLDRFEAGPDGGRLAVLLLERGGGVVADLVVAADALPAEARHEDAVLAVRVEDGELVDATYRPDETERRRERAQARFDRLAGERCDPADG